MLLTYNGVYFDYANPTKEMINIKDILHSLSRINRFVGHSDRAYTVAEHTLLCFLMANRLDYTLREQLLVLIHDFAEAYTGDCPAPLKKLLGNFSEIEEAIDVAIYDYLGIEPPTDEEYIKVKEIDLTMLVIEMRDLTRHNYKEYLGEYTHMEMLDEKLFSLSEDRELEEELIRELIEINLNLLLQKVERVG